jgi:hypothetical protein
MQVAFALGIKLCRSEFALAGMLAGFIVSLEIEALLLPLFAPRGWFSQWVHDSSTHSVVAAAGMAPAVWAAWAPSRLVSRLTTALVAGIWTFMVWQFAMQIHGWRVVGIGYAGVLITYFAWPFAVLLLLRWRTGVAFECQCGDVAAPKRPTQFRIHHLLLGMAILGATLAAGRFAFPPEPPEFTPSLLLYACKLQTQGELALNCARVMPLALALVFRWRWLPLGAAVTVAAIAAGVLFDSWRANVPIALIIKQLPISCFRFAASNLTQILPPLLALRLLGCRIRISATKSSTIAGAQNSPIGSPSSI